MEGLNYELLRCDSMVFPHCLYLHGFNHCGNIIDWRVHSLPLMENRVTAQALVMNRYTIDSWLPVTKKEIKSRGWDYVDVIIITGDAYIDHPSYGSSVIGRLIESRGYRVGIIPQPNWQDDLRDFKKMPPPQALLCSDFRIHGFDGQTLYCRKEITIQ